jgi:hypothetical protein
VQDFQLVPMETSDREFSVIFVHSLVFVAPDEVTVTVASGRSESAGGIYTGLREIMLTIVRTGDGWVTRDVVKGRNIGLGNFPNNERLSDVARPNSARSIRAASAVPLPHAPG